MQILVRLLEALPWFAWIPIVAIICGMINAAISSMHRHTERMAMIRMGIHPDAKSVEKPYYEEQEV